MATTIRPEISKNKEYYIDRERFYELKHFCRQYPDWKKEYQKLRDSIIQNVKMEEDPKTASGLSRKTEDLAIKMAYISEKIDLVDSTINNLDELLSKWVFLAVTKGFSYDYMRVKLGMNHSKGSFYNEFRKFFWILSTKR